MNTLKRLLTKTTGETHRNEKSAKGLITSVIKLENEVFNASFNWPPKTF